MPQVKAGRRDAAADAAAQGEALIAIGRYEHALATIARGLILAPGDVRLHCQRSIALLRLGRIRGALQAAGDAISADTDEPWGHQLKAAALSAQARSRMRLWRRQFGRQAQSAARRAVHLAADDASSIAPRPKRSCWPATGRPPVPPPPGPSHWRPAGPSPTSR